MSGAADSLATSAIAAVEWLQALEFPRPNGSAALDSATALFQDALGAAGLDPRALPFDCHPHRGLAAAGALLLAAAFLALAGRRRSRRLAILPLLLWLAAAGCLGGSLDFLLPARTQDCLLVSRESLAPPRAEVLLLAHLDSKSEPLDHVSRTLLLGVTVVSALGAWIPSLRRRRPPRWLLGGAIAALLASAAQLSLGSGWSPESAGIIDDAGACVLLADLASDLVQRPLLHTRVHFLWTSGEEVGTQGAAAATGHPQFPDVHRFVNLEGIGAGSDVAVALWELQGWRPWHGHPGTRDLLSRCDTAPLRALPFPLWTDAGALHASGLEGITLLNLKPGASLIRGLHGSADRLESFHWKGYARTRTLLRCTLEAMDDAPP